MIGIQPIFQVYPSSLYAVNIKAQNYIDKYIKNNLEAIKTSWFSKYFVIIIIIEHYVVKMNKIYVIKYFNEIF